MQTYFPQSKPRNITTTGYRLAVGILIFLLAVLIIPILLAGGGWAYFQYSGAIAPDVYVGDTAIGGLTIDQAAAKLNQDWNEKRMLTVSDGQRSWQARPIFFGLWLDPNVTAQEAFRIDRSGNILNDLSGLLNKQRVAVTPAVVFVPERAQTQLEGWAGQINQPAQDAVLRLEGGQVVVAPGQNGTNLDVTATLAALAADPVGVMQRGSFQLDFTPVAPRVGDVSAAAAQAEQMLTRPLHILAYDPISGERIAWDVPRETIAGWLRITQSESGPQVTLEENQVLPYLTEWEKGLAPQRSILAMPDMTAVSAAWDSGKPLELVLKYAPTTYVVQAGDTLLRIGWKVGMPYWHIQKANPGVSDGTLSAGQQLVIPSLNELLPLPIVVDKRIVISISDQRMRTYQDGALLNEYVISTGIPSSPTQPGVYQIQSHIENAYASNWNLWMPDFLGIYEAVPGFWNGIHGLPMLSSGVRLWANVLGRPASYGCIILNLQNASTVYNWAQDGVVVQITP